MQRDKVAYVIEGDSISREVTALVTAVRMEIASSQCVLLEQPRLYPRAFALAGLSHTCVLLERLDAERRTGDDMVARVLARAHWEAYVVSTYLHYGGLDAYLDLAGSARKALRTQHTRISAANQRIVKNRERLETINSSRREHNKGIAARNARTGENIPMLELVSLPSELPLPFDLGPILAQMTSVQEARFSIEDMERRAFKLAAEAEGEHVRELSNYDFLYRSLSFLGAHPTHWVLERYLAIPGLMIHVLPVADVAPLAETAVFSGLGLTAFLAGRVLQAFRCDVSYFDTVTERGVDRAKARANHLELFARLLVARIAQIAADANDS